MEPRCKYSHYTNQRKKVSFCFRKIQRQLNTRWYYLRQENKKTHMQNRATLIARFFLFLTHKALTQVLGLNSKRYILHRTQSKHASACEQPLNKSYHSFAAI